MNPGEIVPNGNSHYDSDSRDCVDIVLDGPGDTTVRPPRPELLKLGLAERELLIQVFGSLEKALYADLPPVELKLDGPKY